MGNPEIVVEVPRDVSPSVADLKVPLAITRTTSRFYAMYSRTAKEYDKKRREGHNPPPTFDAEYRSSFYEAYHKESQDHDKEFVKKYDDDLNTTLIFAGLFSAVASAFIVNIQPELQPNYERQTVEILKILVRSVNDPTPGATPEFPQSPDPPQTIIQVQSILYSSLGTALFAAFLAMLGKQWLNRYVVGSIADRCHHRQRKLDGMTTWYFNVLMESLPFMLQVALLLLGCALSRYLWGLQRTVAGVVIGITSFGILLYLIIVVVGSLYTSCPYQTPASQVIHRIWERYLPNSITGLPTTFRHLTNLYGLFQSIHRNETPQAPDVNGYTVAESKSYILDSHCIAWILETPFSSVTHTTALKFLATLPFFPRTNPAVTIRCLDLLLSCIDVGSRGWVVILSGSEELADTAATAFTHILVQLHKTGSSSLDDLCQRYKSHLSKDITFAQKPPIAVAILHHFLHDKPHQKLPSPPDRWELSPLAHEVASRALIIRSKQQRRDRGKVPRWILRFVFYSLSRHTLPSDAVVSSCFRIISEGLGGAAITNESVELPTIIDHIVSQIKDSKKPADKPLASILPYALTKAEGGDPSLLDEILLAVRRFPQEIGWVRSSIGPMVYETLSGWDSGLPTRAVLCALPYLEHTWFHIEDKEDFIDNWLSAAARLEYTQEIGRNVVEVLLRMASVYQWRLHITLEAWRWLKKRPQLPPVCLARSSCCKDLGGVSAVKSLNDPELLKEYLVVVWSEWDWLAPWVCSYMCTAVRESFGGEEMQVHRDELRGRLLTIQKRLDLGLGNLRKEGSEMPDDYFQSTKEAYEGLLETLTEMEAPPISRDSGFQDQDSDQSPLAPIQAQ